MWRTSFLVRQRNDSGNDRTGKTRAAKAIFIIVSAGRGCNVVAHIVTAAFFRTGARFGESLRLTDNIAGLGQKKILHGEKSCVPGMRNITDLRLVALRDCIGKSDVAGF